MKQNLYARRVTPTVECKDHSGITFVTLIRVIGHEAEDGSQRYYNSNTHSWLDPPELITVELAEKAIDLLCTLFPPKQEAAN